ncbi:hypothetical protein E2320_005666, partial [Naja naja]
MLLPLPATSPLVSLQALDPLQAPPPPRCPAFLLLACKTHPEQPDVQPSCSSPARRHPEQRPGGPGGRFSWPWHCQPCWATGAANVSP